MDLELLDLVDKWHVMQYGYGWVVLVFDHLETWWLDQMRDWWSQGSAKGDCLSATKATSEVMVYYEPRGSSGVSTGFGKDSESGIVHVQYMILFQ